MLEFAEFGKSDISTIIVRFLCFYFDTQANKEFNLFQHPESAVSNELVAHICNAFVHITTENIQTFPTLKPDFKALTLDAIQQRFFNQFVYGAWGLESKPLSINT